MEGTVMTISENPLLVLGIPKSVLVYERALGDLGNVRELAEANYRTLSKRYHPDLPGGNAELMTKFGNAITELRDTDALSFYADELVGEGDVASLYQQQLMQEKNNQDLRALYSLVSGCNFIDQYKALGIEGPTSYLASLDSQRIEINVLSPHRAYARVTDTSFEVSGPTEPDPSLSVRLNEGVWTEGVIKIDEDEVEHSIDTQVLGPEAWMPKQPVKLIGFVGKKAEEVRGENTALGGLAASQYDVIDWQEPAKCWFLQELRFAKERPQMVTGLVLYRANRFAVTGNLIAEAPIKKTE